MGNTCVRRGKQNVDWYKMMVLRPAVGPHIHTMLSLSKQNKWSEEQKMVEFTNLCVQDWERDLAENRRTRNSIHDGPRKAHMQNVEIAVETYHRSFDRKNEAPVISALRGLLQVDREIHAIDVNIRQLEKFVRQANMFKQKEKSNQSREIRKDFVAIAKMVGWFDADKAHDRNDADREIDDDVREVEDVDERYEQDLADSAKENDSEILQKMFQQYVYGPAEPSRARHVPERLGMPVATQYPDADTRQHNVATTPDVPGHNGDSIYEPSIAPSSVINDSDVYPIEDDRHNEISMTQMRNGAVQHEEVVFMT